MYCLMWLHCPEIASVYVASWLFGCMVILSGLILQRLAEVGLDGKWGYINLLKHAVDGSGHFLLMVECSRVFGLVNFAGAYLVVSKLDPVLKPPAACCSTTMRPVLPNDNVVLVGWRNSSVDFDRYC
ncbi:hypothetical protein Nepgr_023113 [Nepenthes gracilis]|uniref:Uncharacterized protein n=1 Tax=Nepenthes gracilis TaxID=150966 RepID=A0AAD3XZ24_NEPGR|nr:hypothetical protein Nepgr_023113 [Nepenthes gracilis]